jgi:hypothetical protein
LGQTTQCVLASSQIVQMTSIITHSQCMLLRVAPQSGTALQEHLTLFEVADQLAESIALPTCQVISDWISSAELEQAIGELKSISQITGRRSVMISGLYLEDQVTVCTLEALVEGSDAHLLTDLIFARDRRRAASLEARLVQAGAVPTTLRQVLYLWQTAEQDSVRAARLKDFLVRFDVATRGSSALRTGLS